METLTYQKEVKAIKEHSCNFCGTKINIGEAYMKSTHKHDGDVYDWKTHKYCAEIAERLKMYDDADEGVTMDDFMETIHCKHDDLLINQLPLTKNNRKNSAILFNNYDTLTSKINFGMLYVIARNLIRTQKLSLAHNGLQISEGTNSIGIVRWNLGFCLCAVIASAFYRIIHL